jgi:hypothetical protein
LREKGKEGNKFWKNSESVIFWDQERMIRGKIEHLAYEIVGILFLTRVVN